MIQSKCPALPNVIKSCYFTLMYAHLCMKYPFLLFYAESEFGISLINSSPRVTGGAVIVDFTTNRPISFAQCFLTGQTRRNCKYSFTCTLEWNPHQLSKMPMYIPVT